jgi:hypothetical protein
MQSGPVVGVPHPPKSAGDLNDDCKVDFYDFATMTTDWLIDCDLTPENPACVPK